MCCAVVARFRPQNKAELALGGESIVDFETEDTCSINVRSGCYQRAYGQASDTSGKGNLGAWREHG